MPHSSQQINTLALQATKPPQTQQAENQDQNRYIHQYYYNPYQ